MNAVTAEGQVTIPQPMLEMLDIEPDSLVEFVVNPDGQVVPRKAGPEQPRPHLFDRVVGGAGPGMSIDEVTGLPRSDD